MLTLRARILILAAVVAVLIGAFIAVGLTTHTGQGHAPVTRRSAT